MLKILKVYEVVSRQNQIMFIMKQMITRAETFTTTNELKKGRTLSPILFVVFMDEVIKKWKPWTWNI